MKPKFNLYEWLTTHFLVNVRNEADFSLKRSYRLNYAKIFLSLIAFVCIVSFSSISLFKWVDSYYSNEVRKDRALRKKIALLNTAIDSLELHVAQKDSFIVRIKKLIGGQDFVNVYQNPQTNPKSTPVSGGNYTKNLKKMSDAEWQLRMEFKNSDTQKPAYKVANGVQNTNKTRLSDFYFFPPITGLVNNHFDAKTKHFGIDIIAKENEPIITIADGSVIYSGWSYDTGYMLVIQHDEDIISVYKHNSSLLKKVGDFVKSGEVVAIIGNSGEITTGPHLHFELWYKGQPLNPLDYIVF